MNDADFQTNAQHLKPFLLKEQLPHILILTCIFFLNILARYLWGPLIVSIEKDLGISHAEAGSVFVNITSGYFIGVIGSWMFSSKLNHRNTIVLSCYTCGLSLMMFMVSGTSLLFFKIMLIVVGATAGLYLPSAIASLSYNLEPKDFGRAFAIHEISPSLALIIGPLLAEFLLGWGSWRIVLGPIAGGFFVVGFIYRIKNVTGNYKSDPLTIRNVIRVLSQPVFWIMLLLFTLGIGANVGIYSMTPLYLQIERGMGQTYTNLIMAIARVAAMFSPLVVGWLAGRYGPRPVIAFTNLLTGTTTVLLGLCPNKWLWAPLFFQPIFATALFPPAYAVLANAVPAGLRSSIIALLMPVAMLLGGGIFPIILGTFGDAHRFYAGFIYMGILVVSSALFMLFAILVEKGIRDRA